jgi:hypothetical protein
MKGNQMATTFTLLAELLAKVDEAAESLSGLLVAFVKHALTRVLVAENS